MPPPEKACLVQDAVYWPPSGFTKDGDTIFGSPVAIKVKWEQDTRINTGPQGNPVSIATVVHVDRDVQEEGKLWLGRYCDLPENPTPVSIITAFNKIGDIKGIHFARMATTMRMK